MELLRAQSPACKEAGALALCRLAWASGRLDVNFVNCVAFVSLLTPATEVLSPGKSWHITSDRMTCFDPEWSLEVQWLTSCSLGSVPASLGIWWAGAV